MLTAAQFIQDRVFNFGTKAVMLHKDKVGLLVSNQNEFREFQLFIMKEIHDHLHYLRRMVSLYIAGQHDEYQEQLDNFLDIIPTIQRSIIVDYALDPPYPTGALHYYFTNTQYIR